MDASEVYGVLLPRLWRELRARKLTGQLVLWREGKVVLLVRSEQKIQFVRDGPGRRFAQSYAPSVAQHEAVGQLLLDVLGILEDGEALV